MNKIIRVIGICLALSLISLSSKSQKIDPHSQEYKDKMYDFISDWWRRPYRYGGVTTRGIDCSAFMREMYKNVYKINLPRTSRQQYTVAKPIKRSELKAGDLVFFKNSRGKWHVGSYIVDGFFVHSSVGKGVVVSNLKEKYYSAHWFSQKRLPQLSPK